LPPYLSTGIIGLRASNVALGTGTTIINGFAGLDPTDGVEGFGRGPYALACDIEAGGLRASAAPGRVQLVEQRYDFSAGELTTSWRFDAGDVTVEIETLAYGSRRYPSLVVHEVSLRASAVTDLKVVGGLGLAGVPGHPTDPQQPPRGGPIEGVDGRLTWVATGDLTRLGMAIATRFDGDAEAERTMSPNDQAVIFGTTYRVRARPGRRYRLRQISAFVPELSHHQPAVEAGRLAALGVEVGWDRLREDNRAEWRALWRGRIVLDVDDPRWQAITDASVYYLLTSVHSGSLASTSLFGMAFWPDYHYYHGHVMWDIETFTIPPLLLLEPDAARSLLDYRSRHLEAARNNARLVGRRGALYPWESCPLHGEEVTPGARPSLQDHVSLDVALAFAAYDLATGDEDHAQRISWPVIRAVADYVESRVEPVPDGFTWSGTLGPREHYEPVDDDAFVNMAAVRVLETATAYAQRWAGAVPAAWREIRMGLRLPVDRRRVILNHTGATLDEPKGATPEGAAGLFPVGFRAPRPVEQATYRYAVERQAPGYVGTPMLSAVMPVFATRIGDRTAARDLLERGYGAFIDAPYLEPDEFPADRTDAPRAAPMFANLGGYLTSVLYGFPRIRLAESEPSDWPEGRVILPEGWEAIHSEGLWTRGRRTTLEAVHGAAAARLIADGTRIRQRRPRPRASAAAGA
jgi:hypothetical protein